MTREQREVFDEVAGAYDRARPDYPAALVDDVFEFARLAPGDRILEIGPGTGKATVAFAARGFPMLCVEPGAQLAELLRANLDALGGTAGEIEISVSRFEDQRFEPASFALAIAAQSFHWVDPDVGFARCAEALRPGAALALFANRPKRGETELHRAVEACYLEHAHALRANALRSYRERDYVAELKAAGAFGTVFEARYPFHREYDADLYVELLSTQSDHRMIEPVARDALLASIRAAIAADGGTLRVDYETHLLLAHRR
jgi:SAM-dependent methyltransferase